MILSMKTLTGGLGNALRTLTRLLKSEIASLPAEAGPNFTKSGANPARAEQVTNLFQQWPRSCDA